MKAKMAMRGEGIIVENKIKEKMKSHRRKKIINEYKVDKVR